MAVIVGLDRAETLRLAAKGLAAVHVGVVVDLQEGLERDAEPLAVTEHAAVVIRQPPGTGIDVETGIKLALLGYAAQFGEAIAAAQGPVAPAGRALYSSTCTR